MAPGEMQESLAGRGNFLFRCHGHLRKFLSGRVPGVGIPSIKTIASGRFYIGFRPRRAHVS